MTGTRVEAGDLLAFARGALEASGSSAEQACAIAGVLVWSDTVGRPTQGVWRLPILCRRVREGGIAGDAVPRFVPTGPATAVVRGAGGAGHHVAKVAMEGAISLAQAAGAGVVAALDSNYFGAGAYYVEMAAEAGMLGIAASNSFPKVVAHGGVRAALGTNPIAFGAPRRDGESLLVDMATSAAAGSTVRRASETGDSLAHALTPSGVLLPVGGAKGYALAVMVEVLCGVLAGPGYGEGVRSMYEQPAEKGRNGHLMIALDIGRFLSLDEYHERIDALSAWLARSGEPGCVVLPGARRWQARAAAERDGICLDTATLGALETLGAELGVALPACELTR